MKIISTQVLRGPNFWSNNRKKLIVIKLDLEKYEDYPTNTLPGFNERLKRLIPSLYTHRCSPGVEGGLFQRLEQGTWLGHVIEHVALELQYQAGMDCGFGRTYGTSEHGVYHVIFAYEVEEAGLYAGEAAVRLIHTLANGQDYDVKADIEELKRIYAENKLGPSTQAIVNEAKLRQIPVSYNRENSLVTFGHGCNQKKIWATVTSHTGSIGADIACDKYLTKKILAANYLPVPQGVMVSTPQELDAAIETLGFPLVTKPKDGNHGRGITTNILTKDKLVTGFQLAANVSEEVIVERYIPGYDYRFLLVNFKVVAVAQRTPALIVGNGKHTVGELIDITNQDSNRGEGHENILTTIKIDEITLKMLHQQQLTLDSILPLGKVLCLKDTANLSSGGTAADVTDRVHPDNIFLAERAARLIGLDICGIDIIAGNIAQPINERNGAIVEVNAGPGLRMHLAPSEGKSRNVAKPIMDMLYPEGSSATIPIVAVTGTNGKTTVVRLIAYMAKMAKHYVGYTSTLGIYLDDQVIYEGDCSGPVSAQTVLNDPKVDFAVLECARGGIARAGLGFDHCDISIITNISSDHLGLNDIETLEDLSELKSVVARSTKKDGYAILNADDELVLAIKSKLKCNIALFGSKENLAIQEHCANGGLAAYIDDGYLCVQKGQNKHIIAHLQDIPITFNGTATCMIQNLLPTVLTGFISHFPIELIKNSLYSFIPNHKNLPGRMNLFSFPNCQVMVDYAHNEGAFLELKNYLDTVKCHKIGIIGAAGDRRDIDIEAVGYLSALLFDELIIRHDSDCRGREPEQITQLLMNGINRVNNPPPVKIISDGLQALDYTIANTSKTFIFYAAEDVLQSINHLKGIELKIDKINKEVSIL